MSKLEKNKLNLFVRTIMPELYSIQRMWNSWDDAIRKITKKPKDEDKDYDLISEEPDAKRENNPSPDI